MNQNLLHKVNYNINLNYKLKKQMPKRKKHFNLFKNQMKK